MHSRPSRRYGPTPALTMLSVVLVAMPIHGSIAGAPPLSAQTTEIGAAAPALAKRIADAGGTTVAVADMTDLQGRITELGRFLAEELSIALVNAPTRLQIIDRGHIRALLAEHKLAEDGLIDPETAAELGRIAGVDVLVTGTVTETSEGLRIAVKALDTRTAAIMAATGISTPSTPTAAGLLRRDVVQGSQGDANPRPAAPAGLPNVRPFQNDFLIVTVEDVAVSKDGTTASVTLGVESKADGDEFIAVQHSSLALSDNLASRWGRAEVSGLVGHPCGLGACEDDRSRYSRIAPGSSQTVVLHFGNRASRPASRPASLNLSMNLYRHRGGNPPRLETFTIGIARIPVP